MISISQQRDTVSLFVGEQRYQLQDVADVLAKTNQAVATLETYRQRLDQVVQRLTALEFQGAAMLDDVLVVLQRLELADRVGQEVVQELVELGQRRQVARDAALRADRRDSTRPPRARPRLRDRRRGGERRGRGARSSGSSRTSACSSSGASPRSSVTATPTRRSTLPVAPRGFRALAQLPRVSDDTATALVARFGALESLLRAPLSELEDVDGLDRSRAREVREALRRLQEHTLADRYLSL